MIFIAIFILLLSISAVSSNKHKNERLPPASGISMIIVAFRHGYRNPAQFLKNDKSRNSTGWGWEGVSQLTNIGKQQAFSLGKFIRNRYKSLLPIYFQPSEVKATSSSAERCQMTLMGVLAGAFPPVGRAIWDRTLKWQPIPFSINDPLLRMYNVKCPTYTKAYQSISDDNLPESKTWLQRERDLIAYIVKNTGLNGSLSDLADVADNIQSIIYNKAPMPDWIQNPKLPGQTKETLVKEILEYAEAHQIQCAVEKPCAKSMAGLWLDEILSLLKQKANAHDTGKLNDRKAQFYAAHTETVLSLMKLLKMDVNETPTSAGFILEFRATPSPQVRALFHEPSHDNPRIRLARVVELPCEESTVEKWCPLDELAGKVSTESFSDWQAFCKLPKCPT